MKKTQTRIKTNYYVDKHGLAVHGAIILMALSAVFRILGCFGLWKAPAFAPTQIALPLCCNFLFILFLVIFGKRMLWMTSVPFVMGSIFFIIKSFGTASVFGKAVCVLIYASAAVVYISTTSGWFKTKWLLFLLLVTAFAYYIAVEDLRIFSNPLAAVTFSTVMQEISAIFIILAFIFTAFAMKNKKPLEECDLPKMKAPKVSVNNDKIKEEKASAAKDEISGDGSDTKESLETSEKITDDARNDIKDAAQNLSAGSETETDISDEKEN